MENDRCRGCGAKATHWSLGKRTCQECAEATAMTDPKTVTVQERLRRFADNTCWHEQDQPAREAADLLDRCKEALEQIAETPNAGWMIAREVLTQLNGGRNVG